MEFVHDPLIIVSETHEKLEEIIICFWKVLTLSIIDIYKNIQQLYSSFINSLKLVKA